MSGGHRHAGEIPAASTAEQRTRQRRVLWWALGLNGTFMVVEVAAGVAFGSLALLADAAHMLSDVVGLGIALVAHSLLSRPSSPRHTYGLQRAEVLGAEANGIILIATSAWIFYEGFRRLGENIEVEGGGLLVVATIGLAINLISAVMLARVRGDSLNMKGAYVHMLADAAGSVGAMIAGAAVILAGADWVDPAVSLFIGALVLWSAWCLLRDATQVLLEATPQHLDADEISSAIGEIDGVTEVHHLHAWSLASDVAAVSVHVVLDANPSLHDAQHTTDEIRQLLEHRFHVEHATVELECHSCAGDPDHLVHTGTTQRLEVESDRNVE